MNYGVIEAVHISSVIFWMAGMLYIPRLFIYHGDSIPGGEADSKFKVMEKKLLFYIIFPSSFFVAATGLFLAQKSGFGLSWVHIKIFGGVILFVAQIFFYFCYVRFKKNIDGKYRKFLLVFNEILAIIVAAMVFVAVLKPF